MILIIAAIVAPRFIVMRKFSDEHLREAIFFRTV